MASILFVDDEPYYARTYVQRLEDAGHEVTLCERVEDGLERFQKSPRAFEALILDFMMPSPPGVSPAETDDGLSAGRWFLREARSLLEPNRTRVVILTNRAVEAVKKIVEQEVMMDMTYVRVCHKVQTPAFYLPTIVKMLLQ